MKVGNTINGLTVTDVKRVNKLNLIQFLKEVDNYLQQGYKLDVNSARQVGLVLMVNVYKTEAASSVKAGSTDVGSVGDQIPAESVASKEAESVAEDSVVPESTVQQGQVNDEPVESAVKEEEVVEEQSPLTPKKTTTRSKKTVQ